MTNDEPGEIHEARAEVKVCFDEMDAGNAGAVLGTFGANAAQTASAW